jgi:hypothetical protein
LIHSNRIYETHFIKETSKKKKKEKKEKNNIVGRPAEPTGPAGSQAKPSRTDRQPASIEPHGHETNYPNPLFIKLIST